LYNRKSAIFIPLYTTIFCSEKILYDGGDVKIKLPTEGRFYLSLDDISKSRKVNITILQIFTGNSFSTQYDTQRANRR